MSNLGDTYLASLKEAIQYCTMNNDNTTHFHDSIEDAEAYKKNKGFDCIIWKSGKDNPNQKHEELYHKLQPDFSKFKGFTDYEIRIMAHDNHLCRYSKCGY